MPLVFEMVSLMKYTCYVMMHDVMIKHTTGITDRRHGKGKRVTQEPLSFRLAWSLGITLLKFSWFQHVLKIVTGF